MKKTLLALALTVTTPVLVLAADYYVVVPSIGKTTTPTAPSAPPAPAIMLTLNGYPLPAALVGRTYAGFDFNTVLQVSGDASFDSQAVSWSLVGGALPEGLALGADGVLSGTPTSAGNASFQVKASYKTADGTQTFEILTGEVQVVLAGATLPAAVQGAAYSYDFKPQLSVSGDPAFNASQVMWSLEGALPAGLVLNADGTITGVPTAEGSYPFTVRAQYLNQQGEQAYQVLVGEIVVSLAAVTAPSGVVGFPYAGLDLKPLVSVTGDAAYTGAGLNWRVASGALPAGLTLADGTISGTPMAKAAGPATVEVSYKGKTAQQALTFDLTAQVKDFGSYRAWSDGTPANSCLSYLQGGAGYTYTGATGSGIYAIDPDGPGAKPQVTAYCDMVTDGGGWMLLANYGRNGHQFYHFMTEGGEAAVARNPQSLVARSGAIGLSRWEGAFGFNLARIEVIAGDNPNQVATFYKTVTYANMASWAQEKATEPNPTKTCTNLAMSANCTTQPFDHNYMGVLHSTLMMHGVNLLSYGYPANADIPVHGHLDGSSGGFCSVTVTAPEWQDSWGDGHWGNGLRIWLR